MSSGVKRVAAPQTPGVGGQAKKPTADPSHSANGSGPAPLTYSSGEPADDVNMNEVEDKVTLEVYLPSGKSSSFTVDSNIPMLDLLVHLAAKSKVSPSGHSLQVVDEETGKTVDFKPNQTIGSLGATTVYIVSKKKKPDWSKAAKASKAAKTFEITNRFTINLPGGQKAVMRISPQLTLEQVFARVCQDKSLDSRRYTLQHPTNPLTPLNLKATIADSKLSEINLIHTGASSSAADATRSMPDLHRGTTAASASAHQDPASWYMPGAGDNKKKKGFLSFLSKKDKKFKPHDAHYNLETSSTASHQTSSAAQARRATTPPPERRPSDPQRAARPKTMYVTTPPEEIPRGQGGATPREGDGDLRAPPRAMGKKRPAPPPPQAVPAVAAAGANGADVKPSVAAPVAAGAPPSTTTTTSNKRGDSSTGGVGVSVSVKPGPEAVAVAAGLSRLHSRNSSDSSGYHELTLSGAESPEAARVPTAFKTSIDTTSIESSDNLNGDSGIQELSPAAGESSGRLGVPSAEGHAAAGRGVGGTKHQAQTHGAERLDNRPKPLPSTKRKKAPPPPPKAKPEPVQEETTRVVTSQSDLPATVMSASIQVAEDPPPPLTVEVDVTDSAEVCTHPERGAEEEEEDKSESESGEPFCLEDILDAVTFEDEPLRTTTTTKTTTTTTTQDPEDGLPEDPEMAMMETESVISEDVQLMEDVRSRPCEFIPPPPPDEPPPDYPPDGGVSAQYADKSTVVGEDNASLAPASLKNSPVATHRRSGSGESLTSVGSIDTIQGLSLAFEQTIAAGQEALDMQQWQTDEDGYSTEMARFVADMSRLTASGLPADSADVSSNNTSISLPETESASDTGSVIRHGVPFHARVDSKDSQSSLSSLGRLSPEGDRVHAAPPIASANAFAMTEEIHAPVETVPPPPEFQTDGKAKDEEEKEEEEITTVTEEYIVPVGPRGLDYSAAVKVSEETSVSRQKDSDAAVGGVFRARPVSITKEEEEKDAEKQKEEPKKPAEKEEFVLTMEDLSSVCMVPLRPKLYVQPKPASPPTPEPEPEPESESDYYTEPALSGSPDRSHVHLAYVSDHGHVHSVTKETHETGTDFTAPSRGGIGAHYASEEPAAAGRGLSVLQLPSMRITGSTEPMTFSDDDRSSESSNDHVYRSTAKLTIGSRTPDDASDDGSERLGGADSRRLSNASSNSQTASSLGGGPMDAEAAARELQQQYSTLQEQFMLWQQQLQQNQALLAAHSGGGGAGDDGNNGAFKALQVQMQMQQQMMQQLQMSMQALTMQQQQQRQHNGVGQDSPTPPPPAPPPPPAASAAPAAPFAPPPPPSGQAPAPKVVKAAVTKSKPRPASSRFEPQLDPREELMIAIRSFGGRAGLNTVPLKATKWVYSNN